MALLATWSVRVWTHPRFPARVDGNSVGTSPVNTPDLTITRSPYDQQLISEVSRTNIFREDRTEYIPPPAPVSEASVVKKPTLPPPELRLNGVMLLNGSKIAILEGKYSVLEGNAVTSKDLKRKGYNIGARIGNYEITEIERKSVTLDDNEGHIVQIRLTERPPEKVILRKGNLLFQKNKDFSPKNIKAAEPQKPANVVPNVPAPAPAPAPAMSPPPPYPYQEVHISGRTVYVPAPSQHVSGN